MSDYILTGKFAILYTSESQDAAWVFQTQEEARSHAFSGEGRFELLEACEGQFEYDTRNGALSAPLDREVLETWETWEEKDLDHDGEWAVMRTLGGGFFCEMEGFEARFGLEGFLHGHKEAVEELLRLLEQEAGLEGLEAVRIIMGSDPIE